MIHTFREMYIYTEDTLKTNQTMLKNSYTLIVREPAQELRHQTPSHSLSIKDPTHCGLKLTTTTTTTTTTNTCTCKPDDHNILSITDI